jgi:signal transduction histidine kinase
MAAALSMTWFIPVLAGVLKRSHPWYDWALLPLTTVPLTARRYRPVEVFVVVTGAYALALLLPSHHEIPFSIGAAIATYTVASQRDRPLSVRLGIRAGLAIAVAELVYDHSHPADALAPLAFLGIAWAVGDNIRNRRASLAELEARAARLEREREEQAVRATQLERARIARELHDVIAHNVSVMVVQASAGEELFDTDPRRAREALAAVASTGRDALGELRRLLGVIRPDPEQEQASFGPQPGLDHLTDLLDQVRDTGLAVELSVAGEPRELSEGASLCAYRIVQEALTNTIKHAGASQVTVKLGYERAALEVAVSDDGRAAAAAAANGSGGHGLIGMRERVALFGGEVEIGPGAGGGFCVRARLPLPGNETGGSGA